MRPIMSISSGVGVSVWIRMVCGSRISVSFTARTKLDSGPGLLGTLRARCKENATSAAVKSDPSWNFTRCRSLMSQVRGSISLHDTAKAGTIFSLASNRIRLSNMFSAVETSLPRSE